MTKGRHKGQELEILRVKLSAEAWR